MLSILLYGIMKKKVPGSKIFVIPVRVLQNLYYSVKKKKKGDDADAIFSYRPKLSMSPHQHVRLLDVLYTLYVDAATYSILLCVPSLSRLIRGNSRVCHSSTQPFRVSNVLHQ